MVPEGSAEAGAITSMVMTWDACGVEPRADLGGL